jgi:hypothetical protein
MYNSLDFSLSMIAMLISFYVTTVIQSTKTQAISRIFFRNKLVMMGYQPGESVSLLFDDPSKAETTL